MKRQAKRMDIPAIIAVSWGLSAVLMTILLYDKLGARGWLWMGVHHIFCLVGVSHELRQYQKRSQESKK